MSMMFQCRRGYGDRVNKWQQVNEAIILPISFRRQSLFNYVHGEQHSTCDGEIAGCQMLTNSRHVHYNTNQEATAGKEGPTQWISSCGFSTARLFVNRELP